MKIKIIKLVGMIYFVVSYLTPTMSAHVQEGEYIEPGEDFITMEPIPGDFIDGIYYSPRYSEKYEFAAAVTSYMLYESNGMIGGYYIGELTVPSEVHGLFEYDETYTVIGVNGIYKNGLTALYLPETIEQIEWTIESCRFLEKVYLNNSLTVLEGIRDCPVLTDCPLPLSLERIGNGWMSGIAISELKFPESLKTLGKGVFCDNPNLSHLSLGNLEVAGDSCFCRLPMLKEVTVPSTALRIGNGSFSGCRALEKIVLLPSEPSLGVGCFSECPTVREVYVYSSEPYDYPEGFLADTDKSRCTLYVPEGCLDAYSFADGWKDFGSIKASINASIGIVDPSPVQWRAFSARGRLIVDTISDDEVGIYSLSGQQIDKVCRAGRNEYALPKGIYVLSARGRAVKISL